MSEHESEVILENLNKKLFKQNKLLTMITEKLDELLKQKPVANNADEDKEKLKKPLKSVVSEDLPEIGTANEVNT